MSNCQDNRPTFLPEAVWKALMNLPALRYMKAPVDTVAQLYEKYPIGNEKGTFAFVHDKNTFYTYHPRGWHRGEWKPISSDGVSSFFEIDAEFLKEGDVLVWDNSKQKFVVKSGNVWNRLIDTATSFIQTAKFFNETEETPTDESDSGIYFIHKNEKVSDDVILEHRALYIVLAKKAIKIFNSSDYRTKVEVDTELAKKANQTQVDDIASSVDTLAVTKAEKSVVDAMLNGYRKQPAVDTYNDTSGGKTSLLNTYPNPQVGWDVLVRDENTRYNWNGSMWVNMETGVYDDNVATKDQLSLTPKIQTIATVSTYTWFKPSNIRLKTSNFVRIKQGAEMTIHLNSSYQFSIFTFNQHLELVEQFNHWLNNGDKVTLYQPYAQWQIRKTNDGAINISDLIEIALSISGSVPDFEIAPSVTEVLPVVTAFPAIQTKVNNVNLIQAVNTISNFGSWKQGGVADAEGSKLTVISPRNKLRNTTGSTTILTINTAYRIALIYYNEDLTQTGSSGWITNGGTFTVNYPYFGINISRVDDGNVLVSDLETINISLSGSIALYDIAASNLELKDLKSKLITGSVKTKNIDLGHLAYQPIGNKTNSIIFFYGQSESDGTETGGVATTTAITGNYMIGNSPNIEAAGANPLFKPLIATLFSASFTGGEQPIVALTNSFSQLYRKYVDSNQKFIAASCGRGSASITKLLDNSPTGLYTTNFMYALNKAVELTANNVDCSYIVYVQGEADYGIDPDAINDKDGYKAALLTLKNKMQADIMTKTGQSNPPLFFIYQTSTGFIQNDTLSISMAQFEFAEENSDVILLNGIYPVTRYNNGNYRAHLSINGSRWFGEMAAKTIFQTLVNGKDYSTVKPLNTYITGNEIHINMYVPVPPLVIDTYTVPSVANYGFKVSYDGINQTISSVSVKGNDIVLTMQNTPSGTVSVTYCPRSTNGRGNIRDSDGFISMYKFLEDSGEVSRWNNGIGYRAKDKDGSYMTGKNYPLCNWLSPFYKEI